MALPELSSLMPDPGPVHDEYERHVYRMVQASLFPDYDRTVRHDSCARCKRTRPLRGDSRVCTDCIPVVSRVTVGAVTFFLRGESRTQSRRGFEKCFGPVQRYVTSPSDDPLRPDLDFFQFLDASLAYDPLSEILSRS